MDTLKVGLFVSFALSFVSLRGVAIDAAEPHCPKGIESLAVLDKPLDEALQVLRAQYIRQPVLSCMNSPIPNEYPGRPNIRTPEVDVLFLLSRYWLFQNTPALVFKDFLAFSRSPAGSFTKDDTPTYRDALARFLSSTAEQTKIKNNAPPGKWRDIQSHLNVGIDVLGPNLNRLPWNKLDVEETP
jgi:hypothetical protein